MVDEVCHICNDKATGKHYGAISCDGCKGFFRRSIRKRHNYVCRFDKICDVTRNQRNACRSCRLQKCLRAGMKSNAIQNERDAIGKRKKVCEGEPDELLRALLDSEQLCVQLRSSVIKSTEQLQLSYDCRGPDLCRDVADRRATMDDVGRSFHQQLLLLVEWAQSLPQFTSLQQADQAALLKAAAAPVIVLGVAFRSMALEDSICLANDTFIPKDHAMNIGDMNCVVGRIIDQLIVPMRRLCFDHTEYVALKAILFFNPVAPGVNDWMQIESARLACLSAIDRRYDLLPNTPNTECRSGRLLLLLPSLVAIAQNMVEDLQLASIFGLANVDSLMKTLLLQEEEKPSDSMLSTLTASSPALQSPHL